MIDNWLPLDAGLTLSRPSSRTGWISTVISDAVLFRATTTYALMHHGSLGQPYSEAELSRRKMVTIKEINEQLSDSNKCLSNSTIGSIAMMASTERVQGNIEELRMHETALKEMVRLRGGLAALGSEVLQIFISWGDLLSSAIQARRPNYDPRPLPSSFQDFPLPVRLSSETPEREAEHDPLSLIFRNLRNLTACMPKRNSNPTLMMAFCKARSSVEYSLLCLSPFATATSPIRIQKLIASDPLFEVRRIGAFLYTEAAFRDCVAKGAFVRSLQSQLIVAIRTCDATWPGLLRREKSIAMWVYCIAGLFDLDALAETWFAFRIASAMHAAELMEWHEVEELVREIMWTKKLTSIMRRHLWPRVKEFRDRRLDAINDMDPFDEITDCGDANP
ncbi:MAG: hypothetical protein Q9195_003055 [Heterodermia aff. obscurata]